MDFYLGGLWDMCLNKLCNARILLKKILKVTFRLPLLSTGLSLRFLPKRRRKKIGPGGHPSKYWLGSTLLNFSDQTRTGVFNVIWPLVKGKGKMCIDRLLWNFFKMAKYERTVNQMSMLLLCYCWNGPNFCKKTNSTQCSQAVTHPSTYWLVSTPWNDF